MTRHALNTRFVLLQLLASIAVASQPLQVAAQAEETTIAGCLQKGANEGEFMLVGDDKQTYQVQAAESVELPPHANHRVELTGTVEKSETSPILKASTLKMVADSCEA
jgi:hypothetical protein